MKKSEIIRRIAVDALLAGETVAVSQVIYELVANHGIETTRGYVRKVLRAAGYYADSPGHMANHELREELQAVLDAPVDPGPDPHPTPSDLDATQIDALVAFDNHGWLSLDAINQDNLLAADLVWTNGKPDDLFVDLTAKGARLLENFDELVAAVRRPAPTEPAAETNTQDRPDPAPPADELRTVEGVQDFLRTRKSRDAWSLKRAIAQAEAYAARWEKLSSAYAARGQFREADDCTSEAGDLAGLAEDLQAELDELKPPPPPSGGSSSPRPGSFGEDQAAADLEDQDLAAYTPATLNKANLVRLTAASLTDPLGVVRLVDVLSDLSTRGLEVTRRYARKVLRKSGWEFVAAGNLRRAAPSEPLEPVDPAAPPLDALNIVTDYTGADPAATLVASAPPTPEVLESLRDFHESGAWYTLRPAVRGELLNRGLVREDKETEELLILRELTDLGREALELDEVNTLFRARSGDHAADLLEAEQREGDRSLWNLKQAAALSAASDILQLAVDLLDRADYTTREERAVQALHKAALEVLTVGGLDHRQALDASLLEALDARDANIEARYLEDLKRRKEKVVEDLKSAKETRERLAAKDQAPRRPVDPDEGDPLQENPPSPQQQLAAALDREETGQSEETGAYSSPLPPAERRRRQEYAARLQADITDRDVARLLREQDTRLAVNPDHPEALGMTSPDDAAEDDAEEETSRDAPRLPRCPDTLNMFDEAPSAPSSLEGHPPAGVRPLPDAPDSLVCLTWGPRPGL